MPVSAVKLSFAELKARGDRALIAYTEAQSDFRIVSNERLNLVRRIDHIHHNRPWPFEANLAFFVAQEVPRRLKA